MKQKPASDSCISSKGLCVNGCGTFRKWGTVRSLGGTEGLFSKEMEGPQSHPSSLCLHPTFPPWNITQALSRELSTNHWMQSLKRVSQHEIFLSLNLLSLLFVTVPDGWWTGRTSICGYPRIRWVDTGGQEAIDQVWVPLQQWRSSTINAGSGPSPGNPPKPLTHTF